MKNAWRASSRSQKPEARNQKVRKSKIRMEKNRFFVWVWRFNSLMLIIALFLAIFLFSIFVHDHVSDKDGKPCENFSNKPRKEWLGYTDMSRDNENIVAALYASSCGGEEKRNILFVDPLSQSHYWLLPDTSSVIAKDNVLVSKEGSEVMVYTIIKADTNDDGSLTKDDRQTIAFSHLNGSNYTEIVDGADKWLSVVFTKGTLHVLYRLREGHDKPQRNFLKTVDYPNFELIQEREIPLPSAEKMNQGRK